MNGTQILSLFFNYYLFVEWHTVNLIYFSKLLLGSKMKKISVLLISLFLAFLVFTTNSQAIELGTEITIYDGTSSTDKVWYGQREDDEVEPGCVRDQIWDLEGFYLNGSILSMVGGYDFENGVHNVTSGDIFIDTDGDYDHGSTASTSNPGNKLVQDTFGFEYVLDIDFLNKTYSVYELSDSSTVTVYYGINQGSNPWQYNASDNTEIALFSDKSFDYKPRLDSPEVDNLSGDIHNVASFDLSFLAPGTNFVSHFTMGCGNDNLMGKSTTPVPEPTTIALMFAGMLGLVGIRKKKKGL